MDDDPHLEQPLLGALLDAKALLLDKHKWTERAQARNALRKHVRPSSPEAVWWDIEGAVALYSNTRGIFPVSAMRLLDSVSRELFGHVHPFAEEAALWGRGRGQDALIDDLMAATLDRVVEVNDYLGYDAAMQVLNRAIELEKAR